MTKREEMTREKVTIYEWFTVREEQQYPCRHLLRSLLLGLFSHDGQTYLHLLALTEAPRRPTKIRVSKSFRTVIQYIAQDIHLVLQVIHLFIFIPSSYKISYNNVSDSVIDS